MTPRSPKSHLAAWDLHAKRSFGQHFLADEQLCERIAQLAAPPASTVVEIGAGLGALTRPLLGRAELVIAVERDRDLVPVLRAELGAAEESGQLRIMEADAKSIDLGELFEGHPRPHVLAGNLPYQITGPLLQLATRSVASLDRVVFLVQLEVAQRLVAPPGSRTYGALSVFVQAAFDVSRPFVIRRGAFYPQPNVDSAVVLLIPRESPIAETTVFSTLVRQAFGQRRKKLSNAWRGVFGLGPAELTRAAHSAGIDLESRGERLSSEQFERMALALGPLIS